MLGVLAPGLPNITGNFSVTATSSEIITGGTFSKTSTAGTKNADKNNANGSLVTFSAANSNIIYGASSTVQPPAIVIFPQIKY